MRAWLQQHGLESVAAALQGVGVETVAHLSKVEEEVGALPMPRGDARTRVAVRRESLSRFMGGRPNSSVNLMLQTLRADCLPLELVR